MDIYIRKIKDIGNNKRESEIKERDSLLKDILNIEYKDLSFNEFKKPYIKNSNVFFNITHSNGYIALATSNSQVGIDMEANKKIKDDMLELLKKKVYNDIDYNQNDFLSTWVIKEAYSKYIGIGISIGLKDIEIDYDLEKVHHKGFTMASYKLIRVYDILIAVVSNDDTIPNIHKGDL